MKLEIYDRKGKDHELHSYDRYTIIINGHIYTMSENPRSPQGCCIYHGMQINKEYLESVSIKIDFDDLPEAMQSKINDITGQ